MPRSIKDIIARKIEDNKLHINNGDENFSISKTIFKTNNSISEYETMVMQRDISDEGWIVKPKIISGLSYNRKPYLTSSLDLFDIIRSLSKKAYILFVYIIKNIDVNSNRIIITPKELMNIINEKYYNNANKVLNELIKNKIIAHSANDLDKNTFVINHNEFFKGNFAKFIYTHNKIYGVVKDECSNRKNAND